MKNFLIGLFTFIGTTGISAQTQSITVHSQTTGKEEIIDVPESMQSEMDSLYWDWQSKNHITLGENCTMASTNPVDYSFLLDIKAKSKALTLLLLLNAMRKGIALTTATACLAGLCLLAYGGIEMIPVGILCVLFAFLYTAGPYPLAYHGWGDILVIVFFGFVPVGCTYYVMCRDWTWNVTLASLACGLIIDTLLMVNNYRDRDQDAKSGKKTIVVRWGANAGQQLYLFLGLAAAWLCLLFIPTGHIWAALLPQIYLLPHFMAWQRMVKINRGKELNSILGETSRNMLLFGVLLAFGLIL